MLRRFAELILLSLPIVLVSSVAHADIFDSLAERASALGLGLRDTGYIIAALGLIVFSFMAIFNKISWKQLAYIMMSCFILTFMIALINYFRVAGDPDANNISFDGNSSGNPSNENTDPTNNPIRREN